MSALHMLFRTPSCYCTSTRNMDRSTDIAASTETTTMAAIANMPIDIRLMIMEELMRGMPDACGLLTLVKTTPEFEKLFRQQYRPILARVANNTCPTHSSLVKDAFQAWCSDGNLRTRSRDDDDASWTLDTDAHDIWSQHYTGDPLKALQCLATITDDVKSLTDFLLDPVSPFAEFKDVASAGYDAVNETVWNLQLMSSIDQNVYVLNDQLSLMDETPHLLEMKTKHMRHARPGIVALDEAIEDAYQSLRGLGSRRQCGEQHDHSGLVSCSCAPMWKRCSTYSGRFNFRVALDGVACLIMRLTASNTPLNVRARRIATMAMTDRLARPIGSRFVTMSGNIAGVSTEPNIGSPVSLAKDISHI